MEPCSLSRRLAGGARSVNPESMRSCPSPGGRASAQTRGHRACPAEKGPAYDQPAAAEPGDRVLTVAPTDAPITIGREFPARCLSTTRGSPAHICASRPPPGTGSASTCPATASTSPVHGRGLPSAPTRPAALAFILTGLTTGRTEGCNRLVKMSNTAPAGSAAPSRPAHLKTPSAKQLRPARTAHESLKFKQYSASAT